MEFLEMHRYLTIYFAIITICYCSIVSSTFREFFNRIAERRLSALPSTRLSNTTVEECARRCVTETGFQCKSFDFNNMKKDCLLFIVSADDKDIRLIESKTEQTDHYQTTYRRLFSRLPGYKLDIVVKQQEGQGLSVEECSRRCVLEGNFKCTGFNYRSADKICLYLDGTVAPTGSKLFLLPNNDYYQRNPEGALADFINYGLGRLKELKTSDVYQLTLSGVTLEACAESCQQKRETFNCLSFDYSFSDDSRQSYCSLSEHQASNTNGLRLSSDQSAPTVNHFEKIGKYMAYFYPTPYAVIIGNDLKTFEKISPDACARMCMEESAFVCKSFDYEIKEAKCMLSGKTGADVGGLYNDNLQQIHHFEMKPLLDCGRELTSSEGGFASPNWPSNHGHHELCIWTIRTSQNKVIRFRFTHFHLGPQSPSSCNPKDDRLIISESSATVTGGIGPSTTTTNCVIPNTKEFTTKTNQVNVTFITNSQVDQQGFRVFYTTEWSCDALLSHAPGELASPNWPSGSYPSLKRCSWRIAATEGNRVRLRFIAFRLSKHNLGHCSEDQDHVKIVDGGTVSSPLIGLYCGDQNPFVVRSSGRDLFVQFRSDSESPPETSEARRGFHAAYVFETKNGTAVYTSNEREVDWQEGEYVELDGKREGEERKKHNDSRGREESLMASGSDMTSSIAEEHRQYKRTMWAIITTLLLLLIAALILLFLLYRHHRKRISAQKQRLVEMRMVELVPLQSNYTKQNNLNVEAKANHCSPSSPLHPPGPPPLPPPPLPKNINEIRPHHSTTHHSENDDDSLCCSHTTTDFNDKYSKNVNVCKDNVETM